MAPPSPTVASWELALRYKKRREELGLSAADIARALGFSRNYWSAVENERARLADDKFEALLDLFKYDAAERLELQALRHTARDRATWPQHRLVGDDLRRLYGLELGAKRIRAFAPLVITGLLQTESYAAALMSTDPAVSAVDQQALVDIRLQRQERLQGSSPLEIEVVISEAALRQRPGQASSNAILKDQLLHLISLIDSRPDRIEIRVVPFSRALGGLHAESTSYLIDFESQHLPTTLWTEGGRFQGFIEEASTIAHMRLSYNNVKETSLSREESRVLIAEIHDSL